MGLGAASRKRYVKTFHQQVVPFELSTGGAIVSVTASNALQLTIGTF